ncbi:MAG: hypothetical protein ACI3XR_04265 [Eubacteriales bacterium]
MKKDTTVAFDLSRARRLILISALGIPLVRVLILFPLSQIIISNLGFGIPYYILYYFSNLLTQTGLFATVGLVISLIYSGRPIGFALSCQSLSLIFVAVLLQSGVFWLLAFLDEAILSLPFSLCNYSLSQVESGELVNVLMSSFMGILPILLIFFVGVALSLWQYQKAKKNRANLSPALLYAEDGKQNPMRSAVIANLFCYLAVTAVNQIVETVLTLIEYSGAMDLGKLPDLLSPYILLLIYLILGYYVLMASTKLPYVKK